MKLDTIPKSVFNSDAEVNSAEEIVGATIQVPDAPIQSNVTSLVVQKKPAVAVSNKRFPENLPEDLGVTLDRKTGKSYCVLRDKANPYALLVGSRAVNSVVRDRAFEEGEKVSKYALVEINDNMHAYAERKGDMVEIWNRIAPVNGGIEIDLGDDQHTRIKIAGGVVETVRAGSETIFHRSSVSKPMVCPAEHGDYSLLKKYVNLDANSFFLLVAWLSYTIAHPKVPSSKYVILSVSGGQGTGKSLLTKLIKNIIDPTRVDVEMLPSNAKDIGVAAQQTHVLCYDNLRQLTPSLSDALCVAATGGAMSARQLYTDSEQHVVTLHVALVLNGIHSFIEQPDLAQRCLPLHLKTLTAERRKSEQKMAEELSVDMPVIIRGIYDLIARTYVHLPNAEVVHSERMYDFCRWLAAMELANGAKPGVYQSEYSYVLKQGQRDALMDNVLAAALLEFADGYEDEYGNTKWEGTPTKLFEALNFVASLSMQKSKDWPINSIALSKRLQSLQAGLLSQGVKVEFSRGKERMISIFSEAAK